jgi:ECF transporter S component (folate family)
MKTKSHFLHMSVRALTYAAMLTALSVVIGIFCKNVLNFANGLFRITFENLPIILSGMLFGPVTGALVGIASDLISYLLSSQVYPPNLIVTAGAAAVGLVSGFVARLIRREGNVRVVLSTASAHLIGSVIIKTIGLYQFYGMLVLWRIPLYLVITTLEALLLCYLFRRGMFRKLKSTV